VVVGNHVTDQFQLDACGEALQLFAAAAWLDRLPVEAARAARVAVDAIIKHDGKPEAGIWETENHPPAWPGVVPRAVAVAGRRIPYR
jgi:hypothetical protein